MVRMGGFRSCVVGVGTSDQFGFDLGKSPLRLAHEAFQAALEDAGLTKEQVDGYATANGSPSGVDYEEFVAAADLKCRYVEQAWAHGRWATTLIAHAAMAVQAGMADYVAICNAFTSPRGYQRHLVGLRGGHIDEGLRDFGGGHGEWSLAGIDTPGAATALVAQRYMDKYGVDEDCLAAVSIGFRRNAGLNPQAIMYAKPLDRTRYRDEPRLIGPFRRCDYSLNSEGATCLIVCSEQRAADLRATPVYIAGAQGVQSSRNDYVLFSRPGLGVGMAPDEGFISAPQPVYQMADTSQAEIDALYVYDAFSSNAWIVLERFGFCREGDAAFMLRDQGVEPGSPLPINTNGGLLSEGHFSGYAHVIEMVRQLRREAGARQIPDASVCQWATPWGDSLVLTR